MSIATRPKRKPRTKPRAEPEKAASTYSDPGWLCRSDDMIAPWDGHSPTWIEREAAHLLSRINAYENHPDAPPEHSGRLLHDSWVVMTGLLNLSENLRAREWR